MSEVNMEMARTVYDSVCATLDAMGLKYDKIENDLVVTLGHRGEDMNHDLIFIVNAEQEVIQLIERLPYSVDTQKAADVACAVCLINSRLLVGKFSYDLGEHISYKVTQVYSGSLIGEETIKRMILALVFSVEEYDDKLMALSKGYLKVDDFKED